MRWREEIGSALTAAAAAASLAAPASGGSLANPWADAVVGYAPGSNPQAGYTDPSVIIGEPSRMTGSGPFVSAVTPFNGPYLPTEVVSIGAGGRLTVAFDEPITNDPSHAFGVDFIIFGNGFFGADAELRVDSLFAEGPFSVSVSADGNTFVPLPGSYNDAMYPMLGYLDLTGPFDPGPGQVPSDFTRPVNPALTFGDFLGRSFSEVVSLYNGSGGGIPFDIAASGLASVSHVRIDVAAGASSVEIDAFSTVPEPGVLASCVPMVLTAAVRRKRLR